MNAPQYTTYESLSLTKRVPDLSASGFVEAASTGDTVLTDVRIISQVNACAMFIAEWCTPAKTFLRSISSYGWKHVAESTLGIYVCNGAFIAAAIMSGYRIERVGPRNPNALFNMRKPSTALHAYLDDKRMGRNPAVSKR